MKNAISSYCTLFLLSTSFAFSQSVTTGSPQGAQTTAMAATGGDPATEASLQKMEAELAQADAARDTAPFMKYLDDNVVALGPGWKAASKAEVMQGIKSSPCSTSNPTLTGFSYKWISPDVVLVSYMSDQTYTCKGKPTHSVEHDSSLWQKKSGKWLSVFHQATADMPVAPA